MESNRLISVEMWFLFRFLDAYRKCWKCQKEEEAYFDIQEAGGLEGGEVVYIHYCPSSQPNHVRKTPGSMERNLSIICVQTCNYYWIMKKKSKRERPST